MEFRADDRAQAIQIGAVLLFATLIIAFSLYQAFVVPNQNEQIELDHSLAVQEQLQDLRNAIVSMPGDSSSTGTTIALGTSYPTRVFALNPAPPSGRLSTDGTTNPRVNLTIANAVAAGETGDVWNGSTRAYNTGGIAYEPDYNQYRNPPTTVYENTLLYNSFGERTLTLAGQSLISGNRISIVTLNGSFSRSSSASTTVDARPISSSERTILVEGNESSPITLNLTTRLSPSKWRSLLEDEGRVDYENISFAPDNKSVPDPFTRVQIPLEPAQYQLQMTKVGVGTGTSEEPAKYMTAVGSINRTVSEKTVEEFVVEVRDRYNNPKSDVPVNASLNETTGFNIINKPANGYRTNEDGQVRIAVHIDDIDTVSTESRVLNVTTDNETLTSDFERSDRRNVGFSITGINTDQSGTTTGGGSGPFDLEWIGPPPELSSADDDYEFRFNRTAGDDNKVNFTVQTRPEGINEIDVDFAVNDSSVDITPTSTTTDGDGNATVTFEADQNKTVALWAIGGGGSDVVNVTISNETSGSFNDQPAGRTQAYPDEYDDQATGNGAQNDSIPPTTPYGTLQDFDRLLANNGNTAHFEESSTGSGNSQKYQGRFGLAFRNISSGDHTINIRYRLVDTDEDFSLKVVDQNGNEIDTSTDHTLDNSGGLNTASFSLSTTESDWIDSNNDLYVVIEDTNINGDKTQTELRMDYIEILST